MADAAVAVASSASPLAGSALQHRGTSSPPPAPAPAPAPPSSALSSAKLNSSFSSSSPSLFRPDLRDPDPASFPPSLILPTDNAPSSKAPSANPLSVHSLTTGHATPDAHELSRRSPSNRNLHQMTTAASHPSAADARASAPAADGSGNQSALSRPPSPTLSHQPSHSSELEPPPSLSTAGIDNDSIATTFKTTPSPTTGRKADLPSVRKALPSASPEKDDWMHFRNAHAAALDKASKGPEAETAPRKERSAAEEPRETQDEIVVNAGASTAMTSSSRASPVDPEDQPMADVEDDEEPISHYPKRKRTSVFQDLSEDKLENSKVGRDGPSLTPEDVEIEKPVRQTVGNAKGVLVGYWRESLVPHDAKKHAVIGFIDVRDRLRTRIQSVDRDGARIPKEYALGPGPGNCWVTFENTAFSDHLIGLDTIGVKEYVRVRAGQIEANDDERIENEHMAVDIAWEKTKAYYQIDDRADLPVKSSQIAHGAVVPETQQPPRAEMKRRKISGFFTAANADGASFMTDDGPLTNHAIQNLDPLNGTRPTSIPIGHWKLSANGGKKCTPENSHAVLGILGSNDMFRVKLLRQTKSGRYFDGNFPSGAGALWINYEDVQLDDHIANLNRNEIKEYCRVRQSHIDKGETLEDVEANELAAAKEAQSRAAIMYTNKALGPPISTPRGVTEMMEQSPGTPSEIRHSARAGLRRESRTLRHEHDTVASQRRHFQGEEAVERSHALAQQELAKAESSQARSSRYAQNRERAAAAAAEETASAAAAAIAATATSSGMSGPPATAAQQSSSSMGRPRFNMSESAQRLNNVWALQESDRLRASGDDNVKIYDGVKFERKAMGPFVGKLTSPGSLITIDGEDFVEYRVLTRPSFY